MSQIKIKELTAEQQSKFPEYIEKWTKIGLSTLPANKEEAEKGIRLMYEIAGLSAPKIVWCGSPLSQGLTRAIIIDKKLTKEIGDSVRGSVRGSVGGSVWGSVRHSVWGSGYGQHDASWLAFYEYFKEVCELKEETKKLQGLWL